MPQYTTLQKQLRRSVRVSFLPQAREVMAAIGDTAGSPARLAGLPMPTPCDGRGICGACRVKFITGAPTAEAWERAHLTAEELAAGLRLGCRAKLGRDSILALSRGGPPIVLDGHRYRYNVAPPAQRAYIEIVDGDVPEGLQSLLSAVSLDEAPSELTLLIVGEELRRVMPGDTTGADHLGVAASLWGDALSGWLLDLRTGKELARAEAKLLSWPGQERRPTETPMAATRRLVRSLCISAHRRSEDVSDIVLVGAHESLEEAAIRRPGTGHDPCVDAASMAAVAGGCTRGGLALVLSTEPSPWVMCLRDESAWLTTAREPVPGLEGFLSMGSPGAVERVELSADVELAVTSGSPGGLTLGGALDCVIELRRLGLLDYRGRLTPAAAAPCSTSPSLLRRLPNGRTRDGFVLYLKPDGPPVSLMAAHIRAIQRLKATFATLCARAMDAADALPEEVERVVLVGEDLSGLNAGDAVTLGMVPGVSKSQVQPLQGAFGLGARLSLLSCEADREMRDIAAACQVLPDRTVEGEWAQALYLNLRGDGARVG